MLCIRVCILAIACFVSVPRVQADEERHDSQSSSSITEIDILARSGVNHEDAVQLATLFYSAGFSETQMAKAQHILSLSSLDHLPTEPIIAKALEGKAKHIEPDGILEAMERVRQRQLFALAQAKKLAWDDDNIRPLTIEFTSTLAAGISRNDLESLIDFLHHEKGRFKAQKIDEVAVESCAVLRDLARMSLPSSDALRAVVIALQEGQSNGIHALHKALHQASGNQSAESILTDYFKKPGLLGSSSGTASSGASQSGSGNGSGNASSGNSGAGGNGNGSGGSGGGGGGGR